MPFERHAPFARLTSLALALGALVLAAMPTLTSPLAEFAAHGVRGCADRVQARLFFGLHGPAGSSRSRNGRRSSPTSSHRDFLTA